MTVRCTRTYRSNRVYSEGEIITHPDQAAWVKRDAPGAWEDVGEAKAEATPPKPDSEPDDEPEKPEVVVKPAIHAETKPAGRKPGRPARTYR